MWWSDGSPVPEEISALQAVTERLRGRPRGGRSQYGMSQELIQIRRAVDLIELEFAVTADEFSDTDEYEQQGSVAPVEWIRHHCQMSGHAAAASACTGAQAPSLPLSTAAMSEGRIGYAHLALLAGTAAAVRQSAGDAQVDEASLLLQAEEHSVGRFRYDCQHARHAADEQGFLREHVDQVERRRLELVQCGDGALALRGMLDSVGGATLRTALEPLARKRGKDDQRGRERRLADALVELAGHCLDEGRVGRRGGQAAHLQVTASLETLMGMPRAPAGDLGFAGAIPAATVQRIACNSSVSRVVFGAKSEVIEVGRAQRMPSPAVRRALLARDLFCGWPDCDRSGSWTVPHHLLHFGTGGSSDLPNLMQLCYRHHWMVHEGGWQLVRGEDQRMIAVPPRPPFMRRAPDLIVAA